MSSEDLVRAWDKTRPEQLTAPPDGQTLEGVIGELQSIWGVPQYPQEYRITIKVAEETQRVERATAIEEAPGAGKEDVAPDLGTGGPKREKAPAAPRVAGSADGRPAREPAPKRRRRGRRRRRGGGGSGPTSPPAS